MTEIVIQNSVPNSTLDGDINASVTSLDVAAGDGANFPAVPFKIGLEYEAMLVTAKSTDTFTVTRAYDNTTATTHDDGVDVKHIHSAQDFPFRVDDTTGDYMAQGDFDMDGNDLLGVGLGDLDGVDLATTTPADGDVLEYVVGSFTEIRPTGSWVSYGSDQAKLIDENDTTYADINHLATGVRSCYIDLGEEKELSRLTFLQADGTRYSNRMYVQWSNNASSWNTFITDSSVTSGLTTWDFTPRTARYWKFEEFATLSTFWYVHEIHAYIANDAWVPKNTVTAFDLANSVKSTADTPDDEFDSTTLNAKWTAVAGTSGTIDLLETGEVERYDLSSRPGWLLMQGGGAADQKVELRQDFTIPDGESIVGCFAWAWAVADQGIINNEQRVGFSLNSTDTAYDTGTYCWFGADTDAASNLILAYDGSVVGDSEISLLPGLFFLRIDRDGLDTYFFFSRDGSAWQNFGSKTWGTIPDNLWVFAGAEAATTDPVPVHACKWVRQGTSSVDPWDPTVKLLIS